MSETQRSVAVSLTSDLISQVEACYSDCPSPVKAAFDALSRSLTHGCHFDLEDDQVPDHCVITTKGYHLCEHANDGMSPSDCEYYKPVLPQQD